MLPTHTSSANLTTARAVPRRMAACARPRLSAKRAERIGVAVLLHRIIAMFNTIGVSGARRNAAAALARDGAVFAFCEQGRITRQRHVGLPKGELPWEAIACVADQAGRGADAYASAEDAIALPDGCPSFRFDHHFTHAATAFWTSSFGDATVIVCDRHGDRHVSIWRADASGIHATDFQWSGPGLAELYSSVTELFGFDPGAEEYRLEALARPGIADARFDDLIQFRQDRLEIAADFRARLTNAIGAADGVLETRADLAASLQRRVGALLVDLVRTAHTVAPGANLCVAGGLFYNSYFTTLVAQSGVFARTFVPVNPGNAGVAAGAALAAQPASAGQAIAAGREPLSPFLGPAYDPRAVKAILDNCKLSYQYLREGAVIERTIDALRRGMLVGWFHGRMEWSARALGNRSILASPVAPYASENLNTFLKQREPHRAYSVSVADDALGRYFDGPPHSNFMEFEYAPKDPDQFRGLHPWRRAAPWRVHTVPATAGSFRTLLDAFGMATGLPVLINTSFNGFHEPIVCTPRDAVRVFYGTGLDMLVIDNFVLQK